MATRPFSPGPPPHTSALGKQAQGQCTRVLSINRSCETPPTSAYLTWSPLQGPLGTWWACGHIHAQAPLSASSKPKSRTHFVRTELISPGRNIGVGRGATRLRGQWGGNKAEETRPGPREPPTRWGFWDSHPWSAQTQWLLSVGHPRAQLQAALCSHTTAGLPGHSGSEGTAFWRPMEASSEQKEPCAHPATLRSDPHPHGPPHRP